MRNFYSTISTAAALLAGFVAVSSAHSTSYSLSDANGKKQITFESKAPAEYMEGTAEGVTGTVVMDTMKSDLALQATVGVPVERMQTGNDVRDDHMRSDTWLDAARYPAIRFELAPGSDKTVTDKGNGVWVIKATGLFTLKGITNPVMVTLTLKQKGKSILITGRFKVHLEDFGVNGPIGIKMIGLKVSSDVDVNLNLTGMEDPGWAALSKKK